MKVAVIAWDELEMHGKFRRFFPVEKGTKDDDQLIKPIFQHAKCSYVTKCSFHLGLSFKFVFHSACNVFFFQIYAERE